MKILAALIFTCTALTLNWCAPVLDHEEPSELDESKGLHNHTNPTRDGKQFNRNLFNLGDIDVSGHVNGGDVSIGSNIDIDVGSPTSQNKDEVGSPTSQNKDKVESPTWQNKDEDKYKNKETPNQNPDVFFMSKPTGPQGPPGTALYYDLLSNTQAGINYGAEQLGAFVPSNKYFLPNEEQQIYVPSSAHQNSATNQITITAEKDENKWISTDIRSAQLETKDVWTTAQSTETKNRGYIEIQALMPAKTDGGKFKGAWPVIGLRGDDAEINIAELKNGEPDVFMSLHSKNDHGLNRQYPTNNTFRLDTDMTKIPVIFGLEWNVKAGMGQIDLTWWITSFCTSTQVWKTQQTSKSLKESQDDANGYNAFFNSFNKGFYVLIKLAQGGDFTRIYDKNYLLVDGPQHIVVESAKVYRIEDAVDEQLFSGDPTEMNNIGYLFQGYDIMLGNPFHVSGLPVDPGFRELIFKANYDSEDKTPDHRYLLPEGTSLSDCSGTCSLSFQTSEISGTKSYQESLSVKASLGIEGSLWKAKFSASAGYKEVQESTSSQSNLFTQSSASCCSYLAQTKTYSPPPMSDNFLKGVATLKDEYVETVYIDFIKSFGTHFIKKALFGSLFGQQSEISQEAWTSMEETGVDIDTEAGLSAFGITGSASFMSEDEKKKAEEFKSKSTKQVTFSVGSPPPSDNKMETWVEQSKSSPAPMKLELGSIMKLFDAQYGVDVSDAVKKNMQTALDGYCKYLLKWGDVETCSAPGPDSPFPNPNADRLEEGQKLKEGEDLTSSNKKYQFLLQDNGNLVISNSSSGKVTWNQGTDRFGDGSYVLVFEKHTTNSTKPVAKGNFALYKDGKEVWSSNTHAYNAHSLQMQEDGNLVLYTRLGQALWASNTAVNSCPIVKQDSTISLTCPSNSMISIISAAYGKGIRIADGSTDKVKVLCEGRESCDVPAKSSVFGDPLPHSQKTLKICHACTVKQSKCPVVNEGKTLTMDCPSDTPIAIISAAYGSALDSKMAWDSTAKVKSMCQGRSTCRVDAKKSIFGDPASGKKKTLQVCYTCATPFFPE